MSGTRVEVGTEIPPLELDVDPEKMKVMAALLADPNPIHFDTRALAALGMDQRPVNQGPLNMGYLQTMLARWAGGRDRLLTFRVRFQGNVLAGDRVRASGTVTGVAQTDRGRVATCDISLEVLGGSTALTGTAEVLIDEETS
ncbi:MaoC family dehydratase [Nocardioides houyundeii]|uniref:MaoC family dehydratase n=1 Tax=Nocardioides houyundeii TaxID=2045452 RepID=UPI000C78A163|nr:MaoC family dehydratase [Nocardioides houyundeii]